MSTAHPFPRRPGGRRRAGTPLGTPRTPVPGDGDGLWVQVDLVDASLPVALQDIVAALWLAAERGELDPGDDVAGPGAAFADVARPVVLYLLMNDHAGILAARRRIAALTPGSPLAGLVERIRVCATDLFMNPLDIPDEFPGEPGVEGGDGW
jgi:hypothetical protein